MRIAAFWKTVAALALVSAVWGVGHSVASDDASADRKGPGTYSTTADSGWGPVPQP
jgi:hypothetical protein